MIKRFLKVIFNISILLVCLFGYYFFNKYYSISIPCLFYKITGFKCPGCGITRCLFSLIEKDIRGAFYYNSLIVILLIPFIIYESIMCYCYILDKPFRKFSNVVWNILLVIVILFGIFRNII